MNVDRTKFLALTISIAATACTATADPDDAALDEEEIGAEAQEASSCIRGAAERPMDEGGCWNLATERDPTAEGGLRFSDFTYDMCMAYSATMKGGTARFAQRCMASKKRAHGLGPVWQAAGDAYDCGRLALLRSCKDTSASSTCSSVVRATADSEEPASTARCGRYLSGLNAKGRRQILSCARGDDFVGLYSCVEGLTQ